MVQTVADLLDVALDPGHLSDSQLEDFLGREADSEVPVETGLVVLQPLWQRVHPFH